MVLQTLALRKARLFPLICPIASKPGSPMQIMARPEKTLPLHRIWLARWVCSPARQGAKTRESVVLPCCCAAVLQDCVLFQ